MRNALNIHRERIATCQLTLSPGYVVPLLQLRSRECSTAILYTRRECSTAIMYTRRECSTDIVYTTSQCWNRGMRYKKPGRHYSCMEKVSREGQCEMLARIKNRMRNALNMKRERIATCQLTLSPGYDVPLLRLRRKEYSTAILYTSSECSTAILYTRRECSTAIVCTHPVLEPGDAL